MSDEKKKAIALDHMLQHDLKIFMHDLRAIYASDHG